MINKKFQKMKILNLLLFGLIMLSSACNSQNPTNSFYSYFKNQKNVTSIKLSHKLTEISGMTCTNDGRIFAHNDEKGVIYQLNYENGKIVKSFDVGKKLLKEDFEGITIVNNLFYLVSSNGNIYEFTEGEDDEYVKYKKYKTHLSANNDVEGICFDPKTNSLLLACKGNPGKKYKGNRAVYEFSLSEKKLAKDPRYLLPIKEILKDNEQNFISKLSEFFLLSDNDFAPSDIEYNTSSDTFYILAFKGKMLVELSRDGEIISKKKLDAKKHYQPEGLTFTLESDLLISDEGGNQRATITKYPLNKE